MAALQKNALFVFRVMVDELAVTNLTQNATAAVLGVHSGLNRYEINEALQYLHQRKYVTTTGQGDPWAPTPEGLDWLERMIANRMALSHTAERVMRYLSDDARSHRRASITNILAVLSLEGRYLHPAIQQLRDYNLIKDIADGDGVYEPTLKGLQAVRNDFKPIDQPSTSNTTFNIHGTVQGSILGSQQNVSITNTFQSVQTAVELVAALEQLKVEVRQAGDQSIIDGEVVDDVEHRIQKAVTEAKKSTPDQKKLVDYLGEAKTIVTTASATTAAVPGLVDGIQKAIEAVQKVFAS